MCVRTGLARVRVGRRGVDSWDGMVAFEQWTVFSTSTRYVFFIHHSKLGWFA